MLPIRKPEFYLSLLGQEGHGKTTLAAALSRASLAHGNTAAMSYAALVERAERGASFQATQLNLRFTRVFLQSPKRSYTCNDFHRHADYVKSVFAGLSWHNDGALLVVRASEGLPRQAREQLRLAAQAGVLALVVFLNTAGFVGGASTLDALEREVREALYSYGFAGDGTEVIRGDASALFEEKPSEEAKDILDALFDALDRLPLSGVPATEGFLFPIDDIVAGYGRQALVYGRVTQGRIEPKEDVALIGPGGERVLPLTDIKISTCGYASMADRRSLPHCFMVLEGLSPKEREQGALLSTPGLTKPCLRFQAEVYRYAEGEGDQRPGFSGDAPLSLTIRGLSREARMHPDEGYALSIPGESAPATIELREPLPLARGALFFLFAGTEPVSVGVVTGAPDPKDR